MGKLRIILLSCVWVFGASLGQAQVWTSQGKLSSWEDLVEAFKTHKVIVLGENHGLKTHQAQHLQILQELRRQGRSVHVGLEFFTHTFQDQIDQYRQGDLPEVDFLKTIGWGSPSFDYYRDQAVFPDYGAGERTWALNAPRELTGQVARLGIEGLTQNQLDLLPPHFSVGRDSYRTRFIATMIDHVKDPKKLQNYFEAQSIWDDTMAWRVQSFQEQHPDAVLVVVVGEFHVQYGGGLPDRLKARGVEGVLTLSQINSDGLDEQDLVQAVRPHAEYGPRADWIWSAPAVE